MSSAVIGEWRCRVRHVSHFLGHLRLESRPRTSSTAFGSGGFTRWWSNPASAVRRRSSCCPQPVSAARTTLLQARLLPHPACDFVAVHARHPDVEEDHVRAVRRCQLQRRRAVVGDPDLVALQPQQHGEAHGGVLVVVHHQQSVAGRTDGSCLLFAIAFLDGVRICS